MAEAQAKIREPVGEGLHTHVKAGREVFEKIIVVNVDGPGDDGVDHDLRHQELGGKLICFDLLTDFGSAGALVTEVERDTAVHMFGHALVEKQVTNLMPDRKPLSRSCVKTIHSDDRGPPAPEEEATEFTFEGAHAKCGAHGAGEIGYRDRGLSHLCLRQQVGG